MSQHYNPPARATSRLLLAAWAALTLAAVAFVATLGTNVPLADEWEFVPALTGNEPALPWLWALHNEHRLPLPRAVYLALFALTHDFRAGMLAQVALMSGLSLALLRGAAKLRGGPHWADVFFPVSLLHAGHWENLLMGYQICFALFTVLVTVIGVIALRTTRESAFRSGVWAGGLTVLLALCGGFGLIAALCISAWLAYLAAVAFRTGSKWHAAVLLAFALFPVIVLALYVQGYQRPAHHPEPGVEPVQAIATVTGQTLAMALGAGVSGVWWAVAGGTVVLGGFTLRALRRSPAAPAALGVFAVAAGIIGVALAIGVSRAGFNADMGLRARYSFLMWPLLGLAYLVWVKHGGRGGKWVPVGLCLAAALAFPTNMGTGMLYGANVRAKQGEIEAEARAGVPADEIAARHLKGVHAERATRAIPLLRAAGVFPRQ